MTQSLPNPTLTVIPAARGELFPALALGASIGVSRWSTDPVGTTVVTFSGANAGSEIRVYLPDGTDAAGVESSLADHVLSWDVYSYGSPNNTVRIVIVHPDYKIKEFTYTAALGNQSIPVQQERDKWYSNPA